MDAAGGSPEALIELLRRLSVTSARHVAMISKEMGVSFTEVVALHLLYDSGGLASKELASLMYLTPGAVTQLADKLERAGYLERTPNPADRRSLLLKETPEGAAAALGSMAPFLREARRHASELSAEERALVGGFLERVMGAMEPPPEEDGSSGPRS